MLENKKNEREKRAKEQPIDRTSKRKKKQKKKRQKFPLNREKIRTHSTQYLLSSNIYIKKERNGREFSEDGSASGRASTGGGASWDGASDFFFLFVFLMCLKEKLF